MASIILQIPSATTIEAAQIADLLRTVANLLPRIAPMISEVREMPIYQAGRLSGALAGITIEVVIEKVDLGL